MPYKKEDLREKLNQKNVKQEKSQQQSYMSILVVIALT